MERIKVKTMKRGKKEVIDGSRRGKVKDNDRSRKNRQQKQGKDT